MTETVWPIKPKYLLSGFFFFQKFTYPDIRGSTSKPVPEPI